MNMNTIHNLGVGLNYHPRFYSMIEKNLDHIDFIEVSPDVLCEEKFVNQKRYFAFNELQLHQLKKITKKKPVVVHGLGLSIGSASGWNEQYLEMLQIYLHDQTVVWHSEHLGFTLIDDEIGRELHAGMILPLPFTEEALNLLIPRIKKVQELIDYPFLLENTTYYLPEYAGIQWDEVDFLNELTQRSGCGLILDLYNFYCNAVNFGFDPYVALNKLDMDSVIEIHLAGGSTHKGFQLDVHSDLVAQEIWRLLEWVLPRAQNLKAVTYELLAQSLDYISEQEVVNQLKTAKDMLTLCPSQQITHPSLGRCSV